MTETDFTIAYGAATGAVGLLSWFSGRRDLRTLGIILVLNWAFSNWVYYKYKIDPTHLPPYFAVGDMVSAVWVSSLMTRPKWPAAAVLSLYLVMEAFHVAAIVSGKPGSFFYFLALNVLFIFQLFCLGGTSGLAVFHRLVGLLSRFNPTRVPNFRV